MVVFVYFFTFVCLSVSQSVSQSARQSNPSKYVEEREGKNNAEMRIEQKSW